MRERVIRTISMGKIRFTLYKMLKKSGLTKILSQSTYKVAQVYYGKSLTSGTVILARQVEKKKIPPE